MESITVPQPRSPVSAVISSLMGWSFDLFDLLVLLYVAGPVGKQIFPVKSATLSLALVFASFGVSVLMRPAGAALFGQLTDRDGRKRIMVVVLLGVGIATAAMGLVPTYAAIGIAAPIIFILLRVIQGLFVGGVTATSHTLGTESVPERWRGLTSGLIGGGGAGIGGGLASISFIVISKIFPGSAFTTIGWRVMFFMGLVLSLVSLIVLYRSKESPLWEEAQQRAKHSGVAVVTQKIRFRDLISSRYKVILLINIGLAAGAGAQYYLTSGFLPTLYGSVMKVPVASRGGILLALSLVVIVASCVAGELSEHFGRRRMLIIIGIVNIICLPILISILVRVNPHDTGVILLVSGVLVFLSNASYAPLIIFFNERYPTEMRSRGTAVSWNTGFMIGGLLPTFVSLVSSSVMDIPHELIYFVIASVAVFLIAGFWSPETRGALDRSDESFAIKEEV